MRTRPAGECPIKLYFIAHTDELITRLLGQKIPKNTLSVLADGADSPGLIVIGSCFDILKNLQQAIVRITLQDLPITPNEDSLEASSTHASTTYRMHLSHPFSLEIATHLGKHIHALAFELEILDASLKSASPCPLPLGLKPRYSIAQALKVAEAACAFAREHVLLGSTAIEYNSLPPDELQLRNDWVEQERSFLFRYRPNPLEGRVISMPHMLEIHETRVAILSHMKVGNCEELMIMAFEFVLKNAAIYAEGYCISGGDHAFLLLNREPGSDACDPATWGEAAVICDPWANRVYKASEYPEKLQTHLEVNGINSVENFNPLLHRLEPIDVSYTTRVLHHERLCRERARWSSTLMLNYINYLGQYARRLQSVQMALLKNVRIFKDPPHEVPIVEALQAVYAALRSMTRNMQSHQMDLMQQMSLFALQSAGLEYERVKRILTRALKHWQQAILGGIEQSAKESNYSWCALKDALSVDNDWTLNDLFRPISGRGMKTSKLVGAFGELLIRHKQGDFWVKEAGSKARRLRQVSHDVFMDGEDCLSFERDLNQNPSRLCIQSSLGEQRFFHRAPPPPKPAPETVTLLTELNGISSSSSAPVDSPSPV
ncbi:hypothetical protein Lgee_2195 [Legionella geestiana]|uniref:Uncharacterized protein n=1 Tax=Legionella geestiana TaxID=45065 RepID=A0A0W0TLM6_9GAMM|nr:hypothetical protein [Legionella geestiana]KTC96512.1 hypothetical protein Lgee_2195 [Legionella geestiana]QBS12553.1 hypothetical protein E4T54_07185 [Legionella geestiana]STX55000.1 Uncharacterised protein [Legionella geestiana]